MSFSILMFISHMHTIPATPTSTIPRICTQYCTPHSPLRVSSPSPRRPNKLHVRATPSHCGVQRAKHASQVRCQLTHLLTCLSINRREPEIPRNPQLRALDSVSTVPSVNALPSTSRVGGLIWNVPQGINVDCCVSTVKRQVQRPPAAPP